MAFEFNGVKYRAAATPFGGSVWTRVREYTHTSPPEVVWEVVLKDDSGQGAPGWVAFGAERISSLNP